MTWKFLCRKTLSSGVALNHAHLVFFPALVTIANLNGFTQSRAGLHSHPSSERQRTQLRSLGFIDSITSETTLEALHARIMKNAGIHDPGHANYILSTYMKFKSFLSAHKLFDEMTERDVRTYTILISGFARVGSWRLGLDCFSRMLIDDVSPNAFTLSSVLKSCSGSKMVRVGKSVHGWIIRNEIELDAVLENSVLDFHLKCGEFESGKRLFEFMSERNTVSWNIVIAAGLQAGETDYAVDLFKRLPTKDTATWNTIISGLLQNGHETTALQHINEMIQAQAAFNESTFSIALSLASSMCSFELGRQIHAQLTRRHGTFSNEFLRASLVDMYSKCGSIDKAVLVFKHMPDSFSRTQDCNYHGGISSADTVTWSSLISGFVQNSAWKQALETFCEMISKGINTNEFTLTTAVSACADSGMLDFGKQSHAFAIKNGHQMDLILTQSLIDMYAKCGCLDCADSLFNQVSERNVIIWTSIISGYAMHGRGKESIQLFDVMIDEGVLPNEVTFVAVLSACSHSGLFEEGCKYFQLMKEVYHIVPVAEHLTCMVDLFGRAGRFDDAKKFISENGISHLSSVWKTLLFSCRLHKNAEMGKWVAETLAQLEPSASEPYLVLSNVCASKGGWDDSAKLRSLMQTKRIKKHPGQSWIN